MLEQNRRLETAMIANIERCYRQYVPALPQEMLHNTVKDIVPCLTAVLYNGKQHIEQL